MLKDGGGRLLGCLVAVLAAAAPGFDRGDARAMPALVRTPAAPTAAAAPVQAGDGLRFEHHLSLDVDPAAQVVHVVHDATFTNEAPDQPIAGGIRYTYFPEVYFPVPTGVAGVRATAGEGRDLPTRVEGTESPLVALVVVDLVPDLRFGRTQQVRLTYDLPHVAPRSASPFRVNQAFVSFPLLLGGDPGLTSVEVRVPAALEVEVVGDEMEERSEGGVTVLHAAPDDPNQWFASVVARDDGALLSSEVDVGEHGAVVRAWPDDPEWAQFAESVVRDGVPALEALIGLEWPATRPIDVLETAAPYLYGYAGWYQPFEGLIEVGDELDQHVVLHELSHLWFNDDLFVERWIAEGFAEVFAAAAGVDLGGAPPEPQPIDPSAPGALPLNEWESPDLEADISAEQEAYGYNAAWSVLDSVADEIGIEALAEIILSVDAGENPYGGSGFDDRTRVRHHWTDLLDLLEIRGGSTTAAGLFGQHVATEAQRAQLDERAASRSRYLAQVDRSGPWESPMAIRLALSDWRFEAADGLMDDADAVLDQRDRLLEALTGLDVEPADLERSYEVATDVSEVGDEAAEALEVVDELQDATSAADRSAGPLERIGLLFNDPDGELTRAVTAFEAGDYGAARDRALDAVAAADGATRVGFLAVLAVAVLLGAVVVLATRPRRRRRAAQRRREVEVAALEAAAQEDERRWGPGPGDPEPPGVRGRAR